MSLKAGFFLAPFLALLAACGAASAKDPPPLAYADVTVPPAPPVPPPPASGDSEESPLFAPSVDPTPSASGSSTANGGSFFEVTPTASPTAPPAQFPPGTAQGGTPIVAAIAALRPGFRQCYRDALAIDPSVKGDMNVEIVVKMDGSVGAMQASAKNIPHDLAVCIEGVVKNGRFDGVATKNDTHVVIPIHLAKP